MNFCRYYFPGQIVFITQVVKDRQMVFDNPEWVVLLRETLHEVKDRHPFKMLGYVFLPDHLHLLIQPTGNSDFSQIMHSMKRNFSVSFKNITNFTGNVNFWQKRFWDHVIRDENDLENHIHYIHNNPIKHGYVKELKDWRESSYFEWQKRGAYVPEVKWDEPLNGTWGE